jgi:hypothetical protein
MLVTLLGMVTLVIFPLGVKAPPAMVVTGRFCMVGGMFTAEIL